MNTGQEIYFQRKDHGLWQDKAPLTRMPAGSSEPETAMIRDEYRPKHHGSEKRRTRHAATRLPEQVKIGLLQKAKTNGWTESKVIAVACEAYLEHDLGEKFGVRLAAQVTDAVDKAMRRHENRLIAIIARIAYQVGQVLNLLLNYLFLSFQNDKKLLRDIEVESEKSARMNIARRTPQIEEVIRKLRQEMDQAN